MGDQNELNQFIPSFGSATNPVDITAEVLGNPKFFKPSLDILTKAENVDGILVYLGLSDNLASQIIDDITAVYQATNKPIVVAWSAAPEGVMEKLNANQIPVYEDPIRAVNALNLLRQHNELSTQETIEYSGNGGLSVQKEKSSSTVKSFLSECIVNGKKQLNEFDSKQILSKYGIPVGNSQIVNSPEEAANAAEKIGFPVVMKIVSSDILHKTESGGVQLNIDSAQAAKNAYVTLLENAKQYDDQAQIDGVLVEEMLSSDREVILGMIQDKTFGPTVMFGLGGVFVEVLKDVSFRVCPLTQKDAEEMIREIKGFEILKGVRGKKTVDLEKLASLIVSFSKMAYELRDEIEEVEINPLMISTDGKSIVAADALIKLRD